MYKFKDFIKEQHDEIDPYGEEDWDDRIYTRDDIKVGDKIKSYSSDKFGIIKKIDGDKIIVTDYFKDWDGTITNLLNQLNVRIFYKEEKVVESADNSDIDPYGEEDWKEDRDKEEFDRSILDVLDQNDYMEQRQGLCRVCGRYAPNVLMLDQVCPDCRDDMNHCEMCGSYIPSEYLKHGICDRCLNDPGWADDYNF